MAQKRIVWMPLPSAPAEFFEQLAKLKSEEAFFDYLAQAHVFGWVEIFGVTAQDPKDLVAVLQEHFKVKHIEQPDRGSDKS